MHVLEAHGKSPRRGLPWIALLAVVLAVVVIFALALSGGNGSGAGRASGKSGGRSSKKSGASTASIHVPTLAIASSSPSNGAENVASDADLTITFSKPVSLGSVRPTISPAVAGDWEQDSSTTIHFDADAPFIPSQTETVTIPGGKNGLRAEDGSELASGTTIQFTTAVGDMLRLQELLAELDYLPLSFTPSGSAPPDHAAAMPQLGSFNWRWTTLPTSLTSLWTQGEFNEISKAAVMSLEDQNNMTVDGIAGPAVWNILLNDVTSHTLDAHPYDYVFVNKVQPENLTLYSDGQVVFSNILVNTGAPGADTQDGTFAVFEHVKSSVMKGTNPNGTTYDDPDVPWASFFNGGDALHGYVRAQYGFPQSNGCVEMAIANAALVWPYTPIGTLVTVVGPSSGPGPTTTTTTTPAPTTTTTPPAATPPATTTPTTAAAATP
jgi:hypothetical protein